MKRDVIIIGAGVVGLMSAYFLHQMGRQVTIIDEGDITNSTSFGNAGMLSAFDKTPLSRPGIISETIKLMLKGESPAKIHFNLDPNLYIWLWNFMKSANAKRMQKSMKLFEKYGQRAIDLYEMMQKEHGLDFDYHHDGLLMIYTEKESFDQKVAHANDASRFEVLDVNETLKYMPCVNDQIQGSVLLKKNAHIDPRRIMNEMKRYLQECGVEFLLNEKITDAHFEGDKLKTISSEYNTYAAEQFVMSTGYQTLIAQKAGRNFLMTPAKGYSITFKMAEELKPKMSSLFADMFIACTPRRNDVRITSKLELGNAHMEVVKSQIESIKNNFKRYTVPFEMSEEIEWSGLRPLTPNDMPLIGRDEKYSNLVYATGLGWLGVTFAPAVGEIISELISLDQRNQENSHVMAFSGFYQ